MAITFAEEVNHLTKLIKASWTSDSNGAASGTTTNTYDGVIYRCITIPSDSDAAPTDDYDIVVTDGNSVDVLMGAGANRDTANTEYLANDVLGAVSESKLTFTVSAAGELNSGTIYLYIV